jgi:hypothetical protein
MPYQLTWKSPLTRYWEKPFKDGSMAAPSTSNRSVIILPSRPTTWWEEDIRSTAVFNQKSQLESTPAVDTASSPISWSLMMEVK